MLHPKCPMFLGLGEMLCLVKMLSQKRKAGAGNVRSPKRVAVIDFSEYQEGGDILSYGAGIAIYEWPALAAFNVKLVAKACQVASSLATETADQLDKAIKLALYGLHWRDHKDLAAKYLQRIGNPLVREVLVVIDPQPDCLADHIKKSGATYAIFDTPGGKNEKRYIHKVSKECCKTTQGKTHAVYISDIAAYYAALLSAKQISSFRAPDIDRELDMKIKEFQRILKNYPLRIIRCQGA